jgi:WD40 repeat protein
MLVSLRCRSVACVALLVVAPAAGIGAEPRVRSDLYGEPLPPGALMRMGTDRLRVGGTVLAIAPDNKAFVATDVDHRRLLVWDISKGLPLRTLEGAAPQPSSAAFSGDGKEIVAVGPFGVRTWSRAEGKLLRQADGPSFTRSIVSLSRDGTVWAAADSKRLKGEKRDIFIGDSATGKIRRQLIVETPDDMALSPDGRRVAVVDGNEVTIFDVATARPVDALETEEPANDLVLSADGKYVAFVEKDSRGRPRRVGVWQAGSGKPPDYSEAENGRLAFGPDGTLFQFGSSGVRFRNVAENQLGRVLDRVGSADSVLSPDGSIVVSDHRSDVRIWDVKTGRSLHDERPDLHSKVGAVCFSPDGTRLATSSDDRVVCVWDVATGKQLWSTRTDEFTMDNLAFTPDGRLLAGGYGYGSGHVLVWDATTGREFRTLPGNHGVAFSPDGRFMVTSETANLRTNKVRLWDGPGGDLLKSFDAPGGAYAPRFVGDGELLSIRTSESRDEADGSARVRSVRDVVGIVWDLRTGRQVLRRATPGDGPWLLSPNGQLLATESVDGLVIVEVPTNREVVRIPTQVYGNLIAFAPDSSRLATGNDKGVHIWDATTGTRLTTIAFKLCEPGSVAFSPDGKRLATGGWSGQVYIWEVPPLDVAAASRKRLSKLWDDLASADAGTGQRAVRSLAASGEAAVAMLYCRLTPVQHPDAAKVRTLLATLDADDFERREAASKSLLRLGWLVTDDLTHFRDDAETPEARLRGSALLEAMDHLREPSPDTLQSIRAVSVLERIGTPAARRVLAELAGGDPAARQTRAAKGALVRMGNRRAP